MDKIKLSAIGLIPAVSTQTVQIGNVEVTVTPTLPYEKVLDMIQWCVDFIIDDRPFISAPLEKVVSDFAIAKYYTNLEIAEFDGPTFDLTRVYEDYDLLRAHGAFDKIRQYINPDQLAFFENTLKATMNSIVAYRNSMQGIIDTLTSKAQDSTDAMQAALSQMQDPDQMDAVEHLMKVVQTLGQVK